MKKHLLFLAVICGAMIGTSCSSDDSPITIPDEITQFAKTKYADLAAMFEIGLDKIMDEGASLTAINFTESGKAILEITKDGSESVVKLYIGETRVEINGEESSTDTAPVIVNNRTYLPIRFVLETFGAGVVWYGRTRTIYVYSEGPLHSVDHTFSYPWESRRKFL